jgi:hypothetical protein
VITFANRTSEERRAIVASLKPGDRVAIGRDQDRKGATTVAEGVVEQITAVNYIKVRVESSRITFYPTGLERGSSAGGLTRGLRVILRRL